MLFKKKSNDEVKCLNCNKSSDESYRFCPHCGNSRVDKTKEAEEYGLIGREDTPQNINPMGDSGMLDKIFSALMKNAIKSMSEEMQNVNNNTKVQSLPNGIRITLGNPKKSPPQKETKKQEITEEQIEKMSKFPRTKAKTNIRRLPDKVIYELNAPGISSTDDIFVSKLENGYEIKAIGKSKVYVNSLPIELPLKKYTLSDKGLTFEFSTK